PLTCNQGTQSLFPDTIRFQWNSRDAQTPPLPNLQVPPARELSCTGDATGFGCPTHDNFKVANTVFAEQRYKELHPRAMGNCMRKAKQRTQPGEWPLITSIDF